MSSDMSSSSDSSPAKSETSSTSTRRTYAEASSSSSATSQPSLPSVSVENTNPASGDSQENFSPQSPKPPTRKYTRRLIPRKYIPMDAIDDNLSEQERMKKLYGEDVRIVDSIDDVPQGWILVEDPNPPAKKEIVKKRWNPFNSSDPNWEVNIERVHVGLPPIDFWDMGVEYTYTADDLW